MFQ
jgi:hypothetical protein